MLKIVKTSIALAAASSIGFAGYCSGRYQRSSDKYIATIVKADDKGD